MYTSTGNYMRAFHGAVFSYEAVRFGVLFPNPTAPCDFAINITNTAQNRAVGFSKPKIRTAPHRTAPHRTILRKKTGPNLGQAAGSSLKSSTLLGCGYGAVRFLTVFTEPHLIV